MSRRENWRRQLQLQLRLRWFCSASFSTELLLFVVSPLSCWLPGDLRLLQLLFKAVAVESETRRVISSASRSLDLSLVLTQHDLQHFLGVSALLLD
jgi:hypothetical protein